MKVFVAAALLLSSFVAGCTSSSDGGLDGAHDDLGLDAEPVLYLNLTIGNETHRFSTEKAPSGYAAGNGTSSATMTVSSANSTATGNATAGNSTESSEPGGEAPLNVSATLGAKGLPTGKSVSWTLDFGDAAAKAGNATGNATAANATAGNATAGNGTAKASGPANGTTVPAMIEHTYTAPGTYNVSLSFKVSDGPLQVLRALLTVTGAAGNGTMNTTASGPVPEPIVIEGTTFGLLGEGSADETFDLVGSAATMTITLEYEGMVTGDDVDWSIAGPGGESHEGTNSGPEDPVTFDAPSEGTWTITLVPYLTLGPVSYTITATFT